MKRWITLTLGLAFCFAMILVVMPRTEQRQAQEESPIEAEMKGDSFNISMDIRSEEEAQVADILWFQKAAELAIAKGVPWFNVEDQKISATQVTGTVMLEPDPMKAEYDANEILSLGPVDDVE